MSFYSLKLINIWYIKKNKNFFLLTFSYLQFIGPTVTEDVKNKVTNDPQDVEQGSHQEVKQEEEEEVPQLPAWMAVAL